MEKEINGKQQKINDEDYEIIKVIESGSPYDAEKWYRQNYGCDAEEARTAIKEIRKKYKITYGEKYIPDSDEIFDKIEWFRETGTVKESAVRERILQWYVITSGIRREKAVDKLIDAGVDFPFYDRFIIKRGCGGELLVIAIVVSILFVLFLLFS